MEKSLDLIFFLIKILNIGLLNVFLFKRRKIIMYAFGFFLIYKCVCVKCDRKRSKNSWQLSLHLHKIKIRTLLKKF